MHISVITPFEQIYGSFLQTSIVSHAQQKGFVSIDVTSLKSYVSPKERIDAPIFGHGAGMLLRPTVIQKAVESNEAKYGKAFKVFFSPQGKKITQSILKKIYDASFGQGRQILLLPARYEGMDTRVEQEYADEMLSVGDFVLLGGDLPAMMLIEGLIRLVPGVVGKQESVEHESFSGPFVDFPTYTEPVEWNGKEVPAILRSGNHQAVDQWRYKKAVQKTVLHHFSWLRSSVLTVDQKKECIQYIPAHYVVLMHSDVLIGPEKQKGTTSVTSMDIHDIARSARTYGISEFFIVTPLQDQQKIVKKLLHFWSEGPGVTYNYNRCDALGVTSVQDSLDAVIEAITHKEGKKPILIATSARKEDHNRMITYYDQERIWAHDRPILFVFGTGKGLSSDCIEKTDYLLGPVHSFSQFNHLSVRSAVAIILDRWLGISEKKD